MPTGQTPRVGQGPHASPRGDLVVTFDAGQTLVELDLDFLATRLAERGAPVAVEALRAAAPAGWRRYDELVVAGAGHPWHALMETMLAGAGVPGVAELVAWLWREQPRRNLWRKPIADMVALARELAASGVPVAVLSNSEGRLAELLAEVGIADPFVAILDSGRLGIEKPDPRIFAAALEAAGARAGIHVGDSWAADVAGALGAGWRAVWYQPRAAAAGATAARDPRVAATATAADDPRVAAAATAADVRAALRAWAS